MQDIRLVALDLDGTVFNDKKEITPRTLAAIRNAVARGVAVLPATGRTASGIPAAFTSIPGVLLPKMAARRPDVVPAARVGENIHPVVHRVVGQHIQQRQPPQCVRQPHPPRFCVKYRQIYALFPKELPSLF